MDCEVSFYSAFLIILERYTLEVQQLAQERDAVLEREQIVTTTPQETVEAVNARFTDKGIAALGIGPFGSRHAKGAPHRPAIPSYGITPPRPV